MLTLNMLDETSLYMTVVDVVVVVGTLVSSTCDVLLLSTETTS